MYVQNFDEEQRTKLGEVLEKETWVKSVVDLKPVKARLSAIPSMRALFEEKKPSSTNGAIVNGNHQTREEDNLGSAGT